MEKFKVSFVANNQQLTATGTKHASDTYADIEATFALGERWTDMDSVSAVWWNDFTRIATVLDSNGKCIVPHEVLTRKGCVRVNLVGSIVEGDELVTRLTSYSAEAVQVNEKIKLTGTETSEITPSQYEQFVANVKADADRAETGADEAEASAQDASESATASANSASDSAQSATASAQSAQNASESAQSAETAKDDAEDARDKILGMRAIAETLEAGSDATASYDNGLLTLGIPRGDKGEQGIQGETGATPNFSIGEVDTLEPNESATASITGTAEEPVLNLGIPKGEQGDVNLSQLEALLPTETASGEIVTITDGQSVVPAKSLKVALEPIQSLNGYDKPWSGGNGKNLLPPKTGQAGIAQLILGDDATAIASASGVYLKSGTYTLSVNSTKTSTIYWYDVSSGANAGIGNTLAPRTVTVSTDGYYFPFLYNSSGVSSSDVSTFQLEAGSSATSYEPYSNVCPISGWTDVDTQRTGKNLLDNNGLSDYTTWESLGSSNYAKPLNLPKDTQVTISGQHTVPSGMNSYVYLQRFDGTDWQNIRTLWQANVSSMPYTFTTDDSSYRLWAYNPSASIATIDWMQIELGSTATDYEPYEGDTYTTDLGRTVYGGTLDVVSGELVVDRAMVMFDGTEDWNAYGSGSASAFAMRIEMSNLASTSEAVVASNYLKPVSSNATWGNYDAFASCTLSQPWIVAGIKTITTVNDWEAYLAQNPLQICYELATPQTVQLSAQEIKLLLGDNNVWSDGKVTLTYNADIQKWVEKKLGTSTTLTMSRSMTAELNETETETETQTE